MWRRILGDVLRELMQTKGEVVDAMRTADADATGIIRRIIDELKNAWGSNRETVMEMDQVRTPNLDLGNATKNIGQLIHRAGSGLESLETRSKIMAEGAGRAMEELFASAAAQHDAIKRNSDLVEQVRRFLRG